MQINNDYVLVVSPEVVFCCALTNAINERNLWDFPEAVFCRVSTNAGMREDLPGGVARYF